MSDWNEDYANHDHCRMTIYVRDTYRRTGRGRTGFELHYIARQCSRPVRIITKSVNRHGYCLPHARIIGIVGGSTGA